MSDDSIKQLAVLQQSRELLLKAIKMGESKVKEIEIAIDEAKVKLNQIDDAILKIE